MKQSTFSVVMANSIKNLLQRYTKGIRFTAILTLLFTIGVGQVWADNCGFWGDGAASVTFAVNGTGKTPSDLNSSGVSDYNLGNVTTSLTITKAWAKVWGRDQFNGITLYYRVKEIDLSSSDAYTSVSLSWDNNFNSNDQFWQNTNVNKTISIDLAPGNYEIEYYFMADAKYESDKYLSNGGSNYHANFTIPSKNLTVAGAANGNTVSGTVTGITKGKAYTITATPTTGYEFDKWTATSGSASITIADVNSGSTTVTFNNYSNDATVTASFNLKSYTVKWVVNKDETTEKVDHGSTPTGAPTIDPNDLPCGDKFVGWTTSFYVHPTDAPATLYSTAADIPAIEGDITFYAVFADYE